MLNVTQTLVNILQGFAPPLWQKISSYAWVENLQN